jgi:hypothetical protein
MPGTIVKYQKLLAEAQQYERRYTTVAVPRKKQLAAPLKAIMNKLRKDTYQTLMNDLLNFLSGKEYQVVKESYRINNEEGNDISLNEK